ncbi:uncharacterized protein LOC123315236 [Coccinella septempunctata]|uniref:uncharacterized protein LOC123315236 n=1 Tax=Coccinella septempunctata TaxID=41139 RepID=UPI001D06E87B|nr:uncharacterized protein LOC123315236 [Coccinella septempunctata]
MPFVQRVVVPKQLSRTTLWTDDGKPKVEDGELEAVTNNTLSNALRQLASLLMVADDIFKDLGSQLQEINRRSEALKLRLNLVDKKVEQYDPKKVPVPESDICTFALRKNHFSSQQNFSGNLFCADSRPAALKALYSSAAKTPVTTMRQLDRWRRDGHRSSRFFMCTPVLGQRRKRIKCNVDIEIETRVPAAVEELRRWTSTEALGDITVTPDCPNRIPANVTQCGEDLTDGTVVSDDEAIDHKLPSPEEQVQVVALKFPSEIVPVDVSGKAFDRMSVQRRSLMNGEVAMREGDGDRKRTKSRRPRSKRRNTLAGTDQKEIENAVCAGETKASTSAQETTIPPIKSSGRSKSSDILRSGSKKESPETKKSHFNTLKQWSKNRYDKIMNRSNEDKNKDKDIDEFNLYETVTMKRRRNIDKKTSHQRSASASSSEKSSVNLPINSGISSVMNIAVRLRESSLQRRERRKGRNKDEPHSSSGNWSASSESGRNSAGSEITTSTAQPKSSTSEATSNNSLNVPVPSSICSRRRFVNASASSSVTSEGTLTPDIIQDLHEDGETSSVYSCDTEGYYTSFHMDSGLKTLKEEDLPATPLHSSNTLDTPSTSAENEYELFGKGSTSTTTSSAGTVCTTLKASESSRSLALGPAVPERKSSLSNRSPGGSLERDESSEKTGTVKRSPATMKASEDKRSDGGVSPDSGHNTSSSPIESTSSPNGVRSGSEFEFSESSDMEGPERIERIRVKTTINSSRIPSMCVITPSPSDDESSQSSSSSNKNVYKNKIRGTDKYINVDQKTGYATLESIQKACTDINQNTASIKSNSVRAPSPSGGTVIIREEVPNPKNNQPIFKTSLLPFNSMLDKIKTNLTNLKNRKEDKSPNRNCADGLDDLGEYVTIADVRNNNKVGCKDVEQVNDMVNKNLKTVLSGKIRETEYISLNELPCNETSINNPLLVPTNDSLERKKRQGARVKLDAEGKVVYSSDSLKRKKGSQSTFEPGPCVKNTSPKPSPLPAHRILKAVRSVNQSERGVPDGSVQSGKVIIKASSDSAPEVVRMPPTTIVGPNRTRSPKPTGRGAYVHVQDAGKPHDKERVPPSPERLTYQSVPEFGHSVDMSGYPGVIYDRSPTQFYQDQYYLGRGTQYQTLPAKKTQLFLHDVLPERSVTPDITRGLNRNPVAENPRLRSFHSDNKYMGKSSSDDSLLDQQLGIPVAMPHLHNLSYVKASHNPIYPSGHGTPNHRTYVDEGQGKEEVEYSFKISPIDPRNAAGFQSSTPSQIQPSKAVVNLDTKLMSPKKSTMSNEELYAVIHKSKKKMNIKTDEENHSTPVLKTENTAHIEKVKTPESGYLGDKIRTRLSWSPNSQNEEDSPMDPRRSNDSRSRLSWACNDRKKTPQTSRLDFKKLLLQKSSNILSTTKKPSAVEQLKLSKQQIQQKPIVPTPEMNILELSGSPRSLVNRRFQNPPGSPKNAADKLKPPKLMSPRSQWRFASPRSDVLSSTILEDCREDEMNSSGEKRPSPVRLEAKFEEKTQSTNSKTEQRQRYVPIAQRFQARRAEFYRSGLSSNKDENKQGQNDKSPSSVPALETSF